MDAPVRPGCCDAKMRTPAARGIEMSATTTTAEAATQTSFGKYRGKVVGNHNPGRRGQVQESVMAEDGCNR